jgi:hypothetical protein
MKRIEKEFNVITGETTITEREETEAEIAEREAFEAEIAEREAFEAEIAAAKAALLEKLGITADEAKLLLG